MSKNIFSKYEFYEIVRVISRERKGLEKIFGKDAVIRGKSVDEHGKWGYAISLPDGVCAVFENEIESTGKFANPDDFKPVGAIKVTVTPDGKGKIKDE